MTDWNAVSAFMANVVPWPGSPQDPGYVNLHYSIVNRKNEPTARPGAPLVKGMGWPFRSVDALVGRASWLNTTTQFKDAWYCLSLQSQTKPNAKDPSKPKAHRLAANALKLKAIWIDMDVGEGAKKYATIEEALKAAIGFRERYKLPAFSAIVGSGSGIHVYWISKTALTRHAWEPYAHGLKALLIESDMKCDAGLTTDPARILRIPGTFNHKTTPPKPVQLFNVPLVMYDFEQALGFLKDHAPVMAAPAQAHSVFAEGVDPTIFVKPAFVVTGPDLNAGIEHREEVLLDPAPIFKHCAFYRDALLNGGKGYDNALWMYSVLGATFMERGNAIAHAVSKGHPTYTPDDTQALYDRKVAERAERGIGYPSCSTIAGAGCKACSSCPLFPKGKSPLNIRPAVTATVTGLNMAAPQQTQGARDMYLPAGYDLDADGFICEVVEQNIGGELVAPQLFKLFQSRITDPWVQSDPDCINFTTTVDKGRVWQASIRHDDMQGSMDFSRTLARNKVKTFPKNKGRLEQFFVSWLSKLHEIAAAQAALPFGWYKEGDDIKGFVFAGKLMKDDGSEHPCGIGDAKLRAIFHPSGDIQNWFAACKTITQQKRPELDAIIALSFSSPLTALVGKNAITMCAYGDSGAGKSSAFSVGVSVWGHSKKGKAVSHSTFNGVMKKMSELSNLPIYWDEIKDPKAQGAVYDFLYTATDGTEKDRMKDGREMQDKGTFQTQMMMAANISFVDFVMKKDPSHVAGVSRVLEYFVKKSATRPVGMISPTDAEVIMDKLQTSYGQMGLLYAKLLAMNHATIKDECIAVCKQVEQDMGTTPEERFWVALVGTLLVGAKLANTLGCDLDVPALKAFLYRVYKDNRSKRDALVSISGTKDSIEGIMTAYFAQVNTNDQAIWTKGMPSGAGKPEPVMMIHGPKDTKNVSVTTAVAMRWDVKGRTLYILKKHLVDYITEVGAGVGTCLKSLETEYGMIYRDRVRLGAGVFYSGRASCCVFENIGPDHDWADLLWMYSPEERPERATAEPEAAEPVTDTGFELDATTGLASASSVQAWVQGATARGP